MHETYTENLLAKCFIDQLLKYGYRNISVKSLTTQADINRTTFYLFFQNKSELAEYVCYTFFSTFDEIFIESLSNAKKENFKSTLRKHYDYIEDNAEIIKALWNINDANFSSFEQMQKGMYNAIKEKLLSQGKRNSISVEIVSSTVAANTMITMKYFIENSCNNKEELIEIIQKALFEGSLYLLD